MEHTPSLAADSGDEDAPRRSLILAGGGMRVSWQAGALCALEEAGLRFHHADGTSGGTMNVAMLMSGRSPREMAERWRALRMRDFAAPLPPHSYLRPLRLPGLGGASGVVKRVFPHLGIDVRAIRAARGIEATFNVCNHATKANEAIEHRDVDLETLVAGISLPALMPAVRRGGDPYIDSVWIKDANLMGAVKRGAEELWIAWCIGNTPAYRDGSFRQYVHMIEQSANGVLFEELDRIRELNEAIDAGHSPYGQRSPVAVHVVKPEYAIPLDPDLFIGRIDAASLVAMGYRDARDYLAAADRERGVPLTPEATRMRDPGVRVLWRETYTGPRARVELTAEAPDADSFIAGPARVARLVGRVRGLSVDDALLREGSVALRDGALDYSATLDAGGRELRLSGRRQAAGEAGLGERLRSLRRLRLELRDDGGLAGAEVLEAGGNGGPPAPVPLPRVTDAPSALRALRTAASFERLMLAELLSAADRSAAAAR